MSPRETLDRSVTAALAMLRDRLADILGLILECAWIIKARKTGVRPTIERFRFWWVGDKKPEGVDASMTLASTPGIQGANAEER